MINCRSSAEGLQVVPVRHDKMTLGGGTRRVDRKQLLSPRDVGGESVFHA